MFWSWINQIVVPQTFAIQRSMSAVQGHAFNKSWYIGGQNQLLWGVRIRQQRVIQASAANCPISPIAIKSGILGSKDCIPDYSESTTDKVSYGGLLVDKMSGNITKNSLYEWKDTLGGATRPRADYYAHGDDGYVSRVACCCLLLLVVACCCLLLLVVACCGCCCCCCCCSCFVLIYKFHPLNDCLFFSLFFFPKITVTLSIYSQRRRVRT